MNAWGPELSLSQALPLTFLFPVRAAAAAPAAAATLVTPKLPLVTRLAEGGGADNEKRAELQGKERAGPDQCPARRGYPRAN